MATLTSPSPAIRVELPESHALSARPALTPADLAELISSFSEVTSRLQSTHETLRAEVARLEGELREAKGQLRRAKQLAALGEMAAGIAHEVRNPLGSIRLYASALAQDLADRPSERSLATKIGAAADRLNAVVGDVLTFAREIRVGAVPVAPGEVVRQAMEACEEALREGGVEGREWSDADDDVRIACDPGLIQQALVNVIRNAAEAMGEAQCDERRIAVTVERRSMLDSDGQRRAMVAITVRDSGPGVPPEVRDRLFNPFFTTRHTGTGLGLAIVHRIVDAHGGRVSIRNNSEIPGGAGERGACVEMLLPAADAAMIQEEARL